MLAEAGFDDVRIVPLPPDARAKGPGLFVATARKDDNGRRKPRARE